MSTFFTPKMTVCAILCLAFEEGFVLLCIYIHEYVGNQLKRNFTWYKQIKKIKCSTDYVCGMIYCKFIVIPV